MMESIIETKGWVLFPGALLNCRTWRPTHGSYTHPYAVSQGLEKQAQDTRTIRRRFGLTRRRERRALAP